MQVRPLLPAPQKITPRLWRVFLDKGFLGDAIGKYKVR